MCSVVVLRLGYHVAEAGHSTPGIKKVIVISVRRAENCPFRTRYQNASHAQNWFEHFVCGAKASL